MQPFEPKHSLTIRKETHISNYIVKKIGKIILVLLFFLAGILTSMAQEFNISGNVSNDLDIPVVGVTVTVNVNGPGGALLSEIGISDNLGDYEIELDTGNVLNIEFLIVSIINCDGNPLTNQLDVSFFNPSTYDDVDFIFCEEDNSGGPLDPICNADFIIFPFDDGPSIVPNASTNYILISSYSNEIEQEDITYNWTINDEEFLVNNIPFFYYDFEEEGEYEICLSIESEECSVSDCQNINILFEAVGGCLDQNAINFNPSASFDDGSCVYDCIAAYEVIPENFGSGEYTFLNLFPEFTTTAEWQISAPGFEDNFENNNPFIQYEFPSSGVYQVCLTVISDECIDTFCESISIVIDGDFIEGCTDPEATNFNPFALIDDGSCYYSQDVFCPPGFQEVSLEIVTDEFPEDISWSIKNVITGDVFASNETVGALGGSFTYLPHQTYYHEFCIPNDFAVLFHLNDAGNDGLCCNYGLGSFELSACGEVIFEGSDFGSDFIGIIESCDGVELISGCMDSNAINFNPLANWDDGSCTYANGADCLPEFFVLPIAVSEEVLTVFVGDTDPDTSNEWEWELADQESEDPYDYFVLDGYGNYEICLTTNNGSCEDTFCQELNFSANDLGLLEFNYENLGNLNFNFNTQPIAANMDEVMRYKWTINNNVFYGHDFIFNFSEAGTYEVCLELISEKGGIIFEHCKSIHAFGLTVKENEISTIGLYPNPTNHSFRLNNANNIKSISIVNINGQLVLQQDYTGQEVQVAQLPKGIYILELTNQEGKKEFLRFSKQ